MPFENLRAQILSVEFKKCEFYFGESENGRKCKQKIVFSTVGRDEKTKNEKTLAFFEKIC